MAPEAPQPPADEKRGSSDRKNDQKVLHGFHHDCWQRIASKPPGREPASPGDCRQAGGPSGRGDQNGGGGRCVQTDGAAVDLDHALLPATLAQQLQFGSRQYAQIGHAGARFPVAIDRANSHATVAARFRQGGCGLRQPLAALPSAAAKSLDIAE